MVTKSQSSDSNSEKISAAKFYVRAKYRRIEKIPYVSPERDIDRARKTVYFIFLPRLRGLLLGIKYIHALLF